MRLVSRKTYAGTVCYQEVYMVSDRVRDVRSAQPPRQRFADENERAEHRTKMARKHHAQLVNANFTPRSYYSTLTFDDEHEVHTFDEARRIRNAYRRRLRTAYPDAVIFLYMGRGKTTSRIHFHMISDGVPSEEIVRMWEYGSIKDCETLRENCVYDHKDHGTDYTGLANYLFDHWTPEQGGHHYSATRNARQPEQEDAEEVKVLCNEDNPPKPPRGYTLVEAHSTRFAYISYKFVKLPPKRRPGRPRKA